jgi:hypothetical protein
MGDVVVSEILDIAHEMAKEREELRETQIRTLRRLLQEGIESGLGIPGDKAFDRLEAKYTKLTSEHSQ